MSFQVIVSREAEDDLQRLFDHVLARELHNATGDRENAARAIDASRHACRVLELTPFSCRKVCDSPFVRELVIPFGATGYVALFEIRDAQTVLVGAVRLQRESNYHGNGAHLQRIGRHRGSGQRQRWQVQGRRQRRARRLLRAVGVLPGGRRVHHRARVDAHVVRPEEYDELPEMTTRCWPAHCSRRRVGAVRQPPWCRSAQLAAFAIRERRM